MRRVALALSGIVKAHGDTAVLRGVDVEVLDGELFVLLGPSGCGKTTLLRAVAGLTALDAGAIVLGGKDITAVAAEARNVAMVFQDYALYPHMTVWNNLAFGLKRHGVPRDEIPRRIARVTRMLGIEPLVARKPHQLSGGQQQRVALGRAIVREPALFLMDEPLSNLDAQVRANTRAELKELQRRLGVTTLYVTHDQIEAMTLADRLAIMNRGRLEQVGPPLEVYRAPATLFVAQFLSSPRLNVLDGELVPGPDGTAVRTAVASFPAPGIGAVRRKLCVGIRPEWLRLSTRPVAGGIPLEVGLVEPLGAEILVHARWGGGDLVARAPADFPAAEGGSVWIDATASRLDLFDEEGRRLAADPPSGREQPPQTAGAEIPRGGSRP
jgi:ABC-type sugar transport system ATPase subunit